MKKLYVQTKSLGLGVCLTVCIACQADVDPTVERNVQDETSCDDAADVVNLDNYYTNVDRWNWVHKISYDGRVSAGDVDSYALTIEDLDGVAVWAPYVDLDIIGEAVQDNANNEDEKRLGLDNADATLSLNYHFECGEVGSIGKLNCDSWPPRVAADEDCSFVGRATRDTREVSTLYCVGPNGDKRSASGILYLDVTASTDLVGCQPYRLHMTLNWAVAHSENLNNPM
ncbi:MAG: hypothetical protein IPJ88_06425 [Myxococcales bacterium]|nr:MAG: hypothetical protein IPJ88_06425 [Myxococcales bacterium]